MSIELELKALKDIARFHAFPVPDWRPLPGNERTGILTVRFYSWKAFELLTTQPGKRYMTGSGEMIAFSLAGLPQGNIFYTGKTCISNTIELNTGSLRAKLNSGIEVSRINVENIPRVVPFFAYSRLREYHGV